MYSWLIFADMQALTIFLKFIYNRLKLVIFISIYTLKIHRSYRTHYIEFYIRLNCSPISSAERVEPAAGSVLVLYLAGFANISSVKSATLSRR